MSKKTLLCVILFAAFMISACGSKKEASTSAIFLHCYGRNPYSLGCVAIPEEDMVRILQSLRPGAKILITES